MKKLLLSVVLVGLVSSQLHLEKDNGAFKFKAMKNAKDGSLMFQEDDRDGGRGGKMRWRDRDLGGEKGKKNYRKYGGFHGDRKKMRYEPKEDKNARKAKMPRSTSFGMEKLSKTFERAEQHIYRMQLLDKNGQPLDPASVHGKQKVADEFVPVLKNILPKIKEIREQIDSAIEASNTSLAPQVASGEVVLSPVMKPAFVENSEVHSEENAVAKEAASSE